MGQMKQLMMEAEERVCDELADVVCQVLRFLRCEIYFLFLLRAKDLTKSFLCRDGPLSKLLSYQLLQLVDLNLVVEVVLRRKTADP